ncbi:MAG: BamA/TamA family outer membrane protein, partial [Planctomycetota bacterium]
REKMDKSERELRNTRYFERQAPNRGVNIELEPSEEQVRDAIVRVQEGQTGSLFLGGGLSSEAGFFGQFTIRERNFDIWNWPGSWRELTSGNALRGGGHTVQLSARMGSERSRFLLRFRNPAVWNSDYSFGTELYRRAYVRDEYDESRTGLNVTGGRKLSLDSRLSLTTGYESIELDDVDSDAAQVIKDDEGSYSKPFMRLTYRIDKRDDIMMPTEGYLSETSVEVSSGDIESVKLSTRGRTFWTVARPEQWGSHVLSLGGRMSILHGYGDRIPVVEKLYAGGMSTLRGFEYRGVSPADPATEDQIGGKSLLVGSAQYSVPVGTEDFRVHTFVDAGYVEEDTWDVLSGWDKLRVSTGVGFRWQAPILGGSSLGVDLAFPIMEEDADDTRTIHFSLGAFRTF